MSAFDTQAVSVSDTPHHKTSDVSDVSDIEVRRYSLKYHPHPTLVIEYHDHAADKTFQRRIRFKPLSLSPSLSPRSRTRNSNDYAAKVADKIVAKNKDILSYEAVSKEQLVDLVQLLLFADGDGEGDGEGDGDDNKGEDSFTTTLPDAATRLRKQEQGQEQDNPEPPLTRTALEPTGIVRKASNLSISETEESEESTLLSPKVEMEVLTREQSKLDVVFGDLNKVSEEENLKAKDVMSVDFERNRVRPEDNEYVYDKRVDFEQPLEENEWDEEDDD